jgi:two-component system, OmpR family, sensor kinase
MRRPFKATSIRGRLTLWSVGVLALALLGCALTVHLTVQTFLLTSIDHDLVYEAKAAFVTVSQDKPDDQQVPGQQLSGALQLTVLSRWRDERGSEMNDKAKSGKQSKQDLSALRSPVKTDITFPPAALPSFSQRHRFMVVRVHDEQGKALPPLSGVDLPDKSTWERQFTLARDHERVATLILDGQPWRVFTMPRQADGKTVGMVQVAYPLQELNSLLRGLDRALLALIPLALLLAGAGSAWLTGHALHPVSRMTRAAMEMEAHDLSRRLPVVGGDELAELATTFNSMFDRLEAAFTQLEAVVERQQRFTADASHELRTPLTTVRANADWALRRPRLVAEYQESLRSILQAADRTDQLIESLLFLARSDSGNLSSTREPQSLAAILQRALATTPRDASSAPITLDLSASPPALVGDAEQLECVFTNLFQNALRHTPADGSIRVSAWENDGNITVMVEDTGEGILAEHLPHICERFYRVDAARSRPGGGAGLGLAICQSIVQAHGGTLRIESLIGEGTRVYISLPFPTSISSSVPSFLPKAPICRDQRLDQALA